jgi:hypothetical protein
LQPPSFEDGFGEKLPLPSLHPGYATVEPYLYIKAVGIGIGGIGKIPIPVVSVSVSVCAGIGKISNRYQHFHKI